METSGINLKDLGDIFIKPAVEGRKMKVRYLASNTLGVFD